MLESEHIKYTDGYKYMLEEEAYFYTGIPNVPFETKRIIHTNDGWMIIKDGFGWNGCSGPTIDDKTNMRACCCHDGWYYLFKKGFPLQYRFIADQMLHDLMLEDGACEIRADYYKFAVKNFGRNSALPKNDKKILIAP